jgi:phage terminase small subunit
MEEIELAPLTEKQKIFCSEYIKDWNGSRAYQAAYPDSSYDSARVSASNLLTNPNIKAHIEFIQKDLEKEAGISRLGLALELKKIAYSSISHLHLNWLERKEFESLTDDQKSCIAEIDTKIQKKNIGTSEEPQIVAVEYVKIKLHDKQRAIEGLRKMLGYDSPDKIDHTSGGETITGMVIK